MFARRGTYGWNHTWAGDFYHILMYARLQPRVLYEESLLKGGLDGAKILVMGDCDVLTESVVKKIQEFQKAGGLIVGDEEVCPVIEPDYLVPRYRRTKRAGEDREALLGAARKLGDWLDSRYEHYFFSENPDVVIRRRRYGSTDYLFAVNDRREFGTYVGNYGLVMEDGLPSESILHLNRKGGFVYEIPARAAVKDVSPEDGKMTFPVALGPCEGRVFMVTERPIGNVIVEAPKSAERNRSMNLSIRVVDPEGNPIDAVIPLEVTIRDPEGVPAEFSGYYGAADGTLSITADLAPNDRIGLWQIRVRDLASGKRGTGMSGCDRQGGS